MIIAVTVGVDGSLKVEADADLNDSERAFIVDFSHVLAKGVPHTLYDFVRLVQANYKGKKTDALIAEVTREYGDIPRV